MIDKYNNVFLRAIQEFGVEKQLIVAIEEMSELTKEITKSLRDKHNADALAEEMADVYIMLAQMQIIFFNGGKVDEWIEVKIKRLRETLGMVDEKADADNIGSGGNEVRV